MELLEITHQIIFADGIAGPDAYFSLLEGMDLLDASLARLDEIIGLFNVAEEMFPFLGQKNLLGAAEEKLAVQPLLQLFDGLAHGRLGDEQLLRSFGEAEGAGYEIENLVPLKIDIQILHHLINYINIINYIY